MSFGGASQPPWGGSSRTAKEGTARQSGMGANNEDPSGETHGERNPRTGPQPAAVKLLTDAEIIAKFGDPSPYTLPNGDISGAWKVKILESHVLPAPLPIAWDHSKKATSVNCHHLVAGPLITAFQEIFNLGLWAELGDYGGCFQWRMQRGSQILSRHCWGIAVDINVAKNPFGGKPSMHQQVIDAFIKQGFAWGGKFHPPRIDGQHFEHAA